MRRGRGWPLAWIPARCDSPPSKPSQYGLLFPLSSGPSWRQRPRRQESRAEERSEKTSLLSSSRYSSPETLLNDLSCHILFDPSFHSSFYLSAIVTSPPTPILSLYTPFFFFTFVHFFRFLLSPLLSAILSLFLPLSLCSAPSLCPFSLPWWIWG